MEYSLMKSITWSLDNFVEELRKSIKGFDDYWTKGWIENPDQYPVRLSSADWWEQFEVWCEFKKGL
jgi:hypothetical protein